MTSVPPVLGPLLLSILLLQPPLSDTIVANVAAAGAFAVPVAASAVDAVAAAAASDDGHVDADAVYNDDRDGCDPMMTC